MKPALNETQLEILNLFSHHQTEEDLKEIKSLMLTYLTNKVTKEADKSFTEKGYMNEIFEKWEDEHFRKCALR